MPAALFHLVVIAKTVETTIPVVDLRRFTHGSEEERAWVGRDVDEACREIGFFVVVNHGVPAGVVRRGWRAMTRFFDLPAAEKALAPQMTADYNYGYSALEGETLSAGHGESNAPDLKEMFATGPYNPASGIAAPRYPPKPRNFQRAWHEYYVALEALADQLLRLFASALGLETDFFARLSDRHASSLRALNYPDLGALGGTASRNRLRASPHTDYGTLTILRSGGPGLQVRNRSSGAWVDVPHVRRSHFVINLGDLMSRWTNDRWVSTPHRVIFQDSVDLESEQPWRFWRRRPNTRRQAVAYFHNLNPDANVSVINTCVEEGHTPKYPPVLAMDHLLAKHLAATTPSLSPSTVGEHETPPEL